MEEQELYPFLFIPCYVCNLSSCWEKVLYIGEKVCLKKNDVFSLGQNKNCFSYIQSGLTCCYVREETGHKDEIRFFIGEKCLIKETFVSANYGEFHTYHRCLSDVVMYHFDKTLLSDPSFMHYHYDLLQNYIFSIAAKSVSAQMFASLIKQKSNSQKLAVYMYGFYLLNNRKLCFQPPITQVQLAELLGLSNLTVNRIISKWKQDGILSSYTKNSLEILDIEKIRALRAGD